MTSVLYSEFDTQLSYCFNRKEAKNYGDAKGNILVGAPLDASKKVVLVDDVITAGTAIRETMEMFAAMESTPQVQGVVIAMNRMEKNNEGENALAQLEADYGFKVISIINLDDVIEALHNREVNGKVHIDDAMMETIRAYRAEYGI
jgi:orotate phosphoribosyltransferase